MVDYARNYRKGVMDDIADGALDTAASLGEAHDSLGAFPQVDARMDQHQDRAYAILREIREAAQDARARRMADAALVHFSRAEDLEAVNEEHVTEAHAHVGEAGESNRSVIGIAEANRNPRRQRVAA